VAARKPPQASSEISAMPEVPVAEDDDARSRYHDVRAAGQLADVGSKANTQLPQRFPKKRFTHGP
jgi:hypothetical protein